MRIRMLIGLSGRQHGGPAITEKQGCHAGGRGDALLLQIVDGGLAGVIFVLPWIMGGRHALGHLLLTVLAVLTALAWTIRQIFYAEASRRFTGAAALILAGAALLLLQAVPLPQPLLVRLVPRHAEILPLWNAAGAGPASLGPWPLISFTPAETRDGLVLFLSYALLFFVAVQRLRGLEDVERLLRWCALSVLGMAIFGLTQNLAGNGKFFWFYDHPFSNTLQGVKGSFTNRNHFAHFLALGIGPLIWWLQHASRRLRPKSQSGLPPTSAGFHAHELKTYFLGLAVAVVLFAGALSLSRGGIAVLGLAVAISAASCCRTSPGIGRFLGTLAAAGVLIFAALSIFGLERVCQRMESAIPGAQEEKNWSQGRFLIWRTTVKALPDFLWLGAGVGSYREVYPRYGDAPDNSVEFTHAESSYLQVLLETGLLGGGLLFLGIALCVFWCWRGWKGDRRLKVCTGAIAGSLGACLAHALVDFVWYVPACMAMTVLLAACGLRVRQLAAEAKRDGRLLPERPESGHHACMVVAQNLPVPFFRPDRRTCWAALAAVTVLLPLSAWMIHNRIGPAVAELYWNQYLLAQMAANSDLPANDGDWGKETVPYALREDQDPPQVTAIRRRQTAADIQRERKFIDSLEKVVSWDPDHARAHLALAEAHLRLFEKFQANAENPIPLAGICDAALKSKFTSRELLHRWLGRAVGDHWRHLTAAREHCRQSLALCPLSAQAYLYLADLCFLEENECLGKQACLDQALSLRPFDGGVAYAAAAEALLAGDAPRWLELLRQSFRCGRRYQRQIIGELVGRTPPKQMQEMIDFINSRFQPDLEGLKFLYDACAKWCPPEQLVLLCRYRAERAESEARARAGPRAADYWLLAEELHTQSGDSPRALDCARRACQCHPDDYRAHYRLALSLMSQKQYAEAESHFRWCRQRTSLNQNLENRIKEAVKGRLNAERCAAGPKNGTYQ
jgi:O-antigen ligase